jgi:RHS repeat-associated protein
MTSRSDGTNTTTYAWDEDNRLTLVTLPSTATVAYTYDVLGRMLTRTDSSGTTYFTWDGWTMVAELAPNGTQTRYYAPDGELLYFEVETATTDQPAVYGSAYYGQNYYGPLVYQVVSDGMGSVRRIMDAYNNVVSTLDYDAYGNALPSTFDPLGIAYRFVGIYGVRWDATTGLYYMRNRWYDPTIERFVGRDADRQNQNRYQYALDNPVAFIDPSGLTPVGKVSVYVETDAPKYGTVNFAVSAEITGSSGSYVRILTIVRQLFRVNGELCYREIGSFTAAGFATPAPYGRYNHLPIMRGFGLYNPLQIVHAAPIDLSGKAVTEGGSPIVYTTGKIWVGSYSDLFFNPLSTPEVFNMPLEGRVWDIYHWTSDINVITEDVRDIPPCKC